MNRAKRGDHPCIICGMHCNPETSFWLHMTTLGKYVSRDYDGSDSQGCFPIGPECLKKQPVETQNIAFKWPKEWQASWRKK